MKHLPFFQWASALRALVLFASSFFATASLHAVDAPFALQLDGSGNCLAVPHTVALNAFPLTVTLWVNASPTPGPERGHAAAE